MPAVVHIPGFLRRLSGGRDELEAEGTTVGEILASLGREHTGLMHRVADLLEPRALLSVFVNGTDIRAAQGLHTAVGDGDEISLIPSIAGGR